MSSLPEYFLKKMRLFHCKRGAPSCEKCKKLHEEGLKFVILRSVSDTVPVARPMLDVEFQGEEYFIPYQIVRSFDIKENALKYFQENTLEFLDLVAD